MSLEEDDDLDAFLPLPKKEPDECDDLVDELCQETENLSQETKRAECLRTSSDSESETSDSNSDGPDMRLDLPVWWAKKIKSHMPLPPERDTKKVRKIRLKVVSGCSGLCAEASVLKALGLKFNIMSAADPNVKCQEFVLENHQRNPPTHWFCTLADQIAGKPCRLHEFASDGCNGSPCTPDLGLIGSPCHPFSTQRNGRFEPGSVQGHEECKVAMTEMLQWLVKFEPRVAFLEQVAGFDMPETKGGPQSSSPKSRFLDELGKTRFPAGGGYWMVTKKLDMSSWCKVSRPRIYMVALRKDTYTRDMAQEFSKIVEAILIRQREQGPIEAHDLLWDNSTAKTWRGKIEERSDDGNQAALKWPTISARIRSDLKISPAYSPWTSRPDFSGEGLPIGRGRKRVLDLIDLTAVLACKQAKVSPQDPRQMKEALKHTLLDYSQSHSRMTFSNSDGVAKCLCTSSELYSYRLDRTLVPFEHLLLQGHHCRTSVPCQFGATNMRKMSGESIALPCLGTLIWALYVSVGFPAAEQQSLPVDSR